MSITTRAAFLPSESPAWPGFLSPVRSPRLFFGSEEAGDAIRRQLLQSARLRLEDGASLEAAGLDAAKIRTLVLCAFDQAEKARKIRNARPDVAWGAAGEGVFLAQGQPVKRFTVVDRNVPHLFRNYMCAERNVLKKADEKLAGEGGGDAALLKAMAVVNYAFDRPDVVQMTPCLLCLESFRESNGLMDPDTLLVALEKTADNRPEIVVRPLKAFLPMLGRQQPSYTDQDIDDLPVVYSEKALAVLGRDENDAVVQALMDEARQAYEESREFKRSVRNGRYAGAAIRIRQEGQPPRIVRGASLHAKNSFYTLPEMDAVSRALTRPGPYRMGRWLADMAGHVRDFLEASVPRPWLKTGWVRRLYGRVVRWLGEWQTAWHPLPPDGRKPARGLEMVAYFSKTDEEHPGVQGLGALYKLSGNDHLLVAVIERDDQGQERLQVRTLEDYLPIRYTKSHDISA